MVPVEQQHSGQLQPTESKLVRAHEEYEHEGNVVTELSVLGGGAAEARIMVC